MTTYYVIAKPFPNGLCYAIYPMYPLMIPTWVPERSLATRFQESDEAIHYASFIGSAIVEEVIE